MHELEGMSTRKAPHVREPHDRDQAASACLPLDDELIIANCLMPNVDVIGTPHLLLRVATLS